MRKCKHKFQPRYDEVYTTAVQQMIEHGINASGLYYTAFESYLQKRTYVFDICVKCGEIRGRR